MTCRGCGQKPRETWSTHCLPCVRASVAGAGWTDAELKALVRAGPYMKIQKAATLPALHDLLQGRFAGRTLYAVLGKDFVDCEPYPCEVAFSRELAEAAVQDHQEEMRKPGHERWDKREMAPIDPGKLESYEKLGWSKNKLLEHIALALYRYSGSQAA